MPTRTLGLTLAAVEQYLRRQTGHVVSAASAPLSGWRGGRPSRTLLPVLEVS